jgi:hypothetical protein
VAKQRRLEMSGFTLIDDRDPTVDALLILLGTHGQVTLSNYHREDGKWWKIRYVFDTAEKTHEMTGSGATCHDALREMWRWAEELIQTDGQRLQ